MSKTLFVCSLALLGVSGCSVNFNGSAPATPGSRYVVGAKEGFMTVKPVVFLCPEKPKSGECKQVDVTIND
jgi:hypothetical protein